MHLVGLGIMWDGMVVFVFWKTKRKFLHVFNSLEVTVEEVRYDAMGEVVERRAMNESTRWEGRKARMELE